MESTELPLPPDLPFPITISSIELHESQQVERGTRLLTYSYPFTSRATGLSETRFGTWDSPIEGTLQCWKVNAGDVISHTRSKDPVVLINEPCKHGMQIGGLCGICGKDVTDSDYTGFSYVSRANIQMTHSARGPTVSLEEAQRLERETAEHLFKSRKLSLIVDLDQTIVHATVDPTVGDWITEGEAWETRSKEDGPSIAQDDVNPNWEALKDVKKFNLAPEGVPPRTALHGGIDLQGCMYYIKPRPGLLDFLHNMSQKYEMHVYTMGTRAYAEAVCTAIDPDGTIFRDRILSRDESESLTQKSLQRLFPCDTSMVVIIDDRADVWEWSPNLLKVRPYDFFVGIGDINSAFLPKVPSLVPSPISSNPALSKTGDKSSQEEAELQEKTLASQKQATIERIVAEVEERPLAKKQEELLEDMPKEGDDNKPAINGDKESGNGENEIKHPPRKALLKNDDSELVRVAKLLDEVHKRFYDAYDSCLLDPPSEKRKASSPDGTPVGPNVPYDVKLIIPRIRAQTLAGAHILFSSVIPLDADPRTTEIWRTAEVFGAICHTSLDGNITHVVTAKRGTVKVDAARRRGGIFIVWIAWLVDSVAHWERQDETRYLVDADSGSGGGNGGKTTPRLPEVSLDEELEEEEGSGELITPNADIWADATAEVDAFLEETDDEEGADFQDEEAREGGGWRTDGSNVSNGSSKPFRGTKRSRSPYSSDPGPTPSDDDTRSRLAKRKKLSEARRGASRLKVGSLPDEVAKDTDNDGDDDEEEGLKSTTQSRDERESTSVDEESAGAFGFDDDDFLAGELEEEEGG